MKKKAILKALLLLTSIGLLMAAGLGLFLRGHVQQITTKGWIISSSAVTQLKDAGMSQDTVNKYFNKANTYLVLADTQVDSLPNAVPVQTFTSYQAIQTAFANNRISQHTKAILYDNEGWQFTPAVEQADPVHYAQLASEMVHSHNLKFINTPALDLVKAASGNRFNVFIKTGMFNAAKYADIFEIQLQGVETGPSFAAFTQEAANQIKVISPTTMLYVGLSTNPSGQSVSSQQLLDDFTATSGLVSGYWLNIPQGGQYCPKCGQAQPQVARQFLLGITH